MWQWLVPPRQTGRTLTRQFGVLSLVVTLAISVALSLVITYFLRKDLLEREWLVTGDYMRAEVLAHLTPADFEAPPSAATVARFEGFYRQVALMPEVVRVKIYDADMVVLWSDERRLLGQRFPDNPHLQAALQGRVRANETGGVKGEHVYEREQFPRVVEVYVPVVFPGSGRVSGVVETYKVPVQVFANIRQARLTVFGTVFGAGAFLYGSLFWIVRRAARRLDEQHRALERTNEELRAVQGQLLEAERLAAIGEVVTAVAHGIRNPLANIRAAAQVARLGAGIDPSMERRLAAIIGEVDRLEGRFRDLLLFVRPARRTGEPIDLNSVLGECLRLIAGRVDKADLRVEGRLAPALPRIAGDAILLEQVLLSLLGNAIDATPSGGVITVTTGKSQDTAGHPLVFAEIQDTGVGIDAAEVAKVFEPFYTTKAQGTGLGLAIAKKFTEAHGGTIAVSSERGAGATFRVMFPAQPAAA